jgi:hypothetical protein
MSNENLIELVMIVKNSGEVLRECLRNNKLYIDYWTIVDTGSNDNTCEIIKEELKDIPGQLHNSKFINFSQARNNALELSSKKCKYSIILDDSYSIMGGDKLRNYLNKIDNDCIRIKIGKFNENCIANDYYSKRIIKSSSNFRYKYRVHEDIDTSEFIDLENKDIFINDIDYSSHFLRTHSRFKNDINMLLLDLRDDPTDAKTLYYLGTTYFFLEEDEKALNYYYKLGNLEVLHPDYLFCSIYNSLCIEYKKNKNDEKFEKGLLSLQKNKLFQNKSEIKYKLAVIYKNQNNFRKAEIMIENIINNSKPKSFGIIEDNLYEFFIPLLYIEIKIILSKYTEAVVILKKLLKFFPNDQQLLNIKYHLYPQDISSTILSDNKTLVIHLGDTIKVWNPDKLNDSRISGSEIMAVNLAKEFLKFNYRIIIFGSFENSKLNINYEGIYDGIEYIDCKYFSEFALTYIIDYLVVSRNTSNLCYYNNVKNVYLWVHDILPIMSGTSKCFQTHKEKFKKLIAITNWQKNKIIENLEIPDEFIYTSRNAINPLRFKKNIDKVPYRFIYSSSALRGLDNLINIFPTIKENYPQATLYLFVRNDEVDNDTMAKIKNMDYVFVNKRLSQEELSIEFLKSDIFLYPTNFKETYCITAVEAMASKCLVVTVDYCGLGEIVKSKGITVPYPIKDNMDELIRKLFFVLERPHLKTHFIETAYNWAIQQSYEELANDWVENLFV